MQSSIALDKPIHKYTRRDYQDDAVGVGVDFFRRKHAPNEILVLPTAAGKSIIAAGVVEELNEPTLILQPSKEILKQNYEKFISYGNSAGIYSASVGRKDIEQVTYASLPSIMAKDKYGQQKSLKHFLHYKNIIIDECFPEGTMVDGVPIEFVSVGSYVNTYNHKTNTIEKKKVIAFSKKRLATNMATVRFSDGSSLICTDNHPIYIDNEGYIPVCELYLRPLTGVGALRIKNVRYINSKELCSLPLNNRWQAKKKIKILLAKVRSGFQGISEKKGRSKLLQLQQAFGFDVKKKEGLYKNRFSILFKGMWGGGKVKKIFLKHESNDISGKRSYMAKANRGNEESVLREDEISKSYVDERHKRKSDGIFFREGLFEAISWWKRKGSIGSSNDSCERVGNGNGSSCSNRKGNQVRIQCSLLLQSRRWLRKSKDCHRSRWEFSQWIKSKGCRRKERCYTESIGVESIEIQEQGSDGEFEWSNFSGYVYNIEVEDNHNYFADGILVHNCHLSTDAKGGTLKDFLSLLNAPKVLGMTATPFRLYPHTDRNGNRDSMLKFLTRTSPKIFSKVGYHIQISELKERGYLAHLKYYPQTKVLDHLFNRNAIKVNSTGADFDERSLREYYKTSNFNYDVINVVKRVNKAGRRCLAFVSFVEDAQFISWTLGDRSATVHGTTPKEERELIEKKFKLGLLDSVVNVGCWTTGFDDEELPCVIIAKPMRSLSTYYQMIGRGMRKPLHMPNKDCWAIDLCANMEVFGRVEDLRVDFDMKGLPMMTGTNGKILTGVPLKEQEVEMKSEASSF